MPDLRKFGTTSNIVRMVVKNKTTGQGLQGISSATSGLVISTITDNEASATTYTGANIEAVATLGTFSAPTSGKVRIKKVDDTNSPGLIELQIVDTRFAVASAKRIVVSVNDAQATMLDTDYEIEFIGITGAPAVGYDDGVKLADGVAHGGTPGSSTATIAAKQLYLKNTGSDQAVWISSETSSVVYIESTGGGTAIDIQAFGGTGHGNGIAITADSYGIWSEADCALFLLGNSGTGTHTGKLNAFRAENDTGGTEPAFYVNAPDGHGIEIAAAGTGKHGINVTSAAGSALSLNTDDGASTVYISNGGANQTGVDIQCTQSGSTGIYINSKDALVLASDGAGKYGIKSVLATGSLDTNFAGVGFLPNDGSAAMMLTSLAIANPSGAGLSIDGSTQGVNIQGADEGVNIQSSAGDGLRIAATGGNDVSLAGDSLIAGDFAAFPETYAADGATVKLSQALYEILAFLEERSTSSTTVTCKKRDGSTTALTLTLNSATQPTAITRAT